MSHQNCIMSHFITSSFDSIGVVRNASTQGAGFHGYHYARKTDLPSHGAEGRGRLCRIMLCRLSVRMKMHTSSYARKTGLPSHGVERRGRPCRIASTHCAVGLTGKSDPRLLFVAEPNKVLSLAKKLLF